MKANATTAPRAKALTARRQMTLWASGKAPGGHRTGIMVLRLVLRLLLSLLLLLPLLLMLLLLLLLGFCQKQNLAGGEVILAKKEFVRAEGQETDAN